MVGDRPALDMSRQVAWEAHTRWIEDQAAQHRGSGYAGLDDLAVAPGPQAGRPGRAGLNSSGRRPQAAGEWSRLTRMASWVRVRTSNRRITAVRWLLMVAGLRKSRSAISSLLRP
jgi:hypothetical protein